MGYTSNVGYQIAQLLEDDGVGTVGTDIFISKEPASPDNCITIYNTGGIPDRCVSSLTERSGEVNNFQVRVRNNDYLTGHAKMESVYSSLHKALKVLEEGGNYIYFRIWCNTLPIDLQRDTTNRAIRTANFSCMRWVDSSGEYEESSSTSSEGLSSSSSLSGD